MEEEGVPILEKLMVPIIIILAIGLAFLLLIKKKVVNLLTGLSITAAPNTTINIIILISVVVIVLFLFYRYKKVKQQP